jgi:hypothetical protein
MTREEFELEHPGEPIAMKLLQGYFWHPKELEPVRLPDQLPMGAFVLLDLVRAPFAFFDNGMPTETQAFYQLTVLEIYDAWPDNATMGERALLASQELDPILNATPSSVGWTLSEDLRPV